MIYVQMQKKKKKKKKKSWKNVFASQNSRDYYMFQGVQRSHTTRRPLPSEFLDHYLKVVMQERQSCIKERRFS